MNLRLLVVPLAAAMAFGGCSREQPAAPAAAPVAGAPAAGVQPQGANVGKVLQVQQAGAYTYAEVDIRGQRVWVAGSQIDVKPGDSLQWGEFAVMRNFEAKSLGRTFGEILFVSSWGPPGAAAAATPAHGSLPPPPAPGMADASGSGIVKSVANAGGYSYLEIDRGGSIVWVAATQTPAKPGDRVEWQGGSEMRNFNAKSLGRTFERVVFAGAVSVSPAR